MSTVTVASVSIPNFRWAIGSGTVYLRIYAEAEFVTSAGIPIQSGNPLITGSWYKQLTCSLAGTDLTIPGFTIDSTTDALDFNGRSATYSAYFYLNNRQLGVYEGFESFRIVPQYSTNPATWALIRQDIANAVYVAPSLIDTYDRQTILELIADAVSMSSGVTDINGQVGPSVTIAAGTNINIVSAANTITVNFVGPVAIADGGTGAASAAGARTNLGAAASGANSDITALTGLTTPLGAAFGGTGQLGGYTIGDLLYASGASALSKLPSAAGVLAASGAASAPAYTASPTLTNITVSGLTSGRVTFAGAAGLLVDSANFLFATGTNRLSVGTTDSANTINLPNAGYLSARGSVAAAQVRIATIADQTKYTGVATSTTVDAITFGAAVPVAQVFTDGGASALNPLAPDYQVRAAGIRVGAGLAGAYNDSSSSNIFHFSSVVTSIGSAPTVAGFFEATGLAAGANVFAFNPVSYLDLAGTTAGTARAAEFNFGGLGVSPNQEVYGLKLVSNAGASTPAGVIRSVIEIERTGTASTYDGAKALNGIVFNDASGQAVSGALITGQGTTATYVGLFTGGTYATGIDFATSTFSSSNQIRLANGGATSSGIRAHNNAGSADFNVARMTTGDYLEYGDGNSGLTGIRFLASAGSSETLRLLGGATGLPGNAGWNQAAPTAQQHITSIPKRALTDNLGTATVNIVFGSPTVTGTNTAFLSDLAPGSTLTFASQAGTYYKVLSITSDTIATLTSNYSGTSAPTTTGSTDYRPLLVEGITGEPWLTIDNQHTLKLYGDSAFGDLRGMLSLTSRVTPAKRLTLGVNDTSSYGYISSFQEGVGWKPLFLQAGAAGTAVGGVVIGTASPSSLGAMLKVEGAQTNPGANNTGSEFNNLSTSTGYFQKISASYQGIGSWVGPNIGVFTITTGGVDASAEDLTNVPLAAFGGKNYFGPYSTQVTSPAPPVNLFTAVVDVYGVPTDSVTRSGATVTTVNGNATINNTAGGPTTWNTPGAADYLQPGDTIMVSNEAGVIYTVTTVTSNTAFDVTPVIAGGGSGLTLRRDPHLIRARNSYGTDRFSVDPGGNCNVFHLAGIDTTPTIAAGTGAGTGPTLSVTGNDVAMHVSVLTGSAPTASATVVTVSFQQKYSVAPRVLLVPANGNAAALSGNGAVWVDSASTTVSSFAIKVGSTNLAATTTYLWDAFVIQ